MHGVIFTEIKKFAESVAPGTWDKLLKDSGIGMKLYSSMQEYPDAEAVALVGSAAKLTGKSVQDILFLFGEFVLPSLLQMYKSLVKPEWKTLDLLQNTEETIHKAVRVRNPGAKPPQLKFNRTSPTEIVLHYDSPRKMCDLARGMITGVAKNFGEKITITETQCMHKGASHCNIVTRVG